MVVPCYLYSRVAGNVECFQIYKLIPAAASFARCLLNYNWLLLRLHELNYMNLKFALVVLLLIFTQPVLLQARKKHKRKHKTEQTQNNDENDDDAEPSDEEEEEKDHMSLKDMRNSYSLELPMNRNGSGTGWNPDKAPMYSYNIYTHKWLFMVHGDMFMRYNNQDAIKAGPLHTEQYDVTNMFVITGQRQSGLDGLLHFNAAFSSDILFANTDALAQFYQDGDNWNNKRTGNRQLPNNIFSELAVSYAWTYADKGDIFIYGGYPAEPALGPVSYLKRPSASFIATSPLTHRWTDGTEISYGVGTLGMRQGKFKIEGSSFTGRTPDKNNYDFNLPLFNSFSGRLSFNPSSRLALQISRGYIKSPDVYKPDRNITRTTASATYVRPIAPRQYFSYSLIWGINEPTNGLPSNAALLEATLKIKRRTGYSRLEWAQKTAYDLNLNPIGFNSKQQYNVSALTVGAALDLIYIKYFTIAGGAQVTGHLADNALNGTYGQYPLSGQLYLHIYPILQ